MPKLLESIVVFSDGEPMILEEGLIVEALIDHLRKTFPDVPVEFLQDASEHPKVAQKLAYAYQQGQVTAVNDETIEAVKDIKVPKMGKGGKVKKTKRDYKIKELVDAGADGKLANRIVDAMTKADPTGEKLGLWDHIQKWIEIDDLNIVEDWRMIRQILDDYQEKSRNGYDVPELDDVSSIADLGQKLSEAAEPIRYEDYATKIAEDSDFVLYRIEEWIDGPPEKGSTKSCHPALRDTGWCVRNPGYFKSYQKGGSKDPYYYLVTQKKTRGDGNFSERPFALIKRGREIKERFNKLFSKKAAEAIGPLVTRVIPIEDVKDALVDRILLGSSLNIGSYNADVLKLADFYDTEDFVNNLSNSILEDAVNGDPANAAKALKKGGVFDEKQSKIAAKTVLEHGDVQTIMDLLKVHKGSEYEEPRPIFDDAILDRKITEWIKTRPDIAIEGLNKGLIDQSYVGAISDAVIEYGDVDDLTKMWDKGEFSEEELRQKVVQLKDPNLLLRFALKYDDPMEEQLPLMNSGIPKLIKKYVLKFGTNDLSLKLRTAIENHEKLTPDEVQKALREEPALAIEYARLNRETIPALKQVILTTGNPTLAYAMVDRIIADEWPEAEELIQQDPELWEKYQKDYGNDEFADLFI